MKITPKKSAIALALTLAFTSAYSFASNETLVIQSSASGVLRRSDCRG
ncbi:MAG: hypothetical protein U5L01_02665 [Rheinheimera sp.]|nr:hypothetical protein [Rheinheimera sp.]